MKVKDAKAEKKAKELLSASIERVESRSIRAWATNAHNQPLWFEIAKTAISNGKNDPDMFAAYIVAVAIGA
jgi:hypothetical protein